MQTPQRLKKCIAHFLPLLVPLFLLMNLNAKSQSNVCPEGSRNDTLLPRQPFLGLQKQKFEGDRRYYRRGKAKAIRKNHTTVIKYRIDVFEKMLTYFDSIPDLDSINVYIGLYTKTNFGNTGHGSARNNRLTVFYSPLDTFKNYGYYWLPPKGRSFDSKDNALSLSQARQAETLYIKNPPSPMIKLVGNLENTEHNYYKGYYPNCDSCSIFPDNDDSGHLSDTRAMIYHKQHFVDELLAEIRYQNTRASTHRRKVKGIRVYFAQDTSRNNRLYLQFALVKRKLLVFKRNFAIDEDANFCNRPAPLKVSHHLKMTNTAVVRTEAGKAAAAAPLPKILTATFDNGHMCPPACSEKPAN